MKILIADSGSTKTDWALVDEQGNVMVTCKTQGISPIHQSDAEILDVLCKELVLSEQPQEVFFYGSGVTEAMKSRMKSLLQQSFPEAKVEAEGDMLGAARALFGKKPGIACILGTGANSCLYDGEKIVMNTPPLGYILGDEGSGAVIGKLFLNGIFKGTLPVSLKNKYLAWSGLDYPTIINKVYRQPLANRFLASICPFISEQIAEGEKHENGTDELNEAMSLYRMILESFNQFYAKNLTPYIKYVKASTEELDFLTGLSCGYAAADAVVIAPYRTHHIIVLILDRGCVNGDLCRVLFEVLRETGGVKYSQVRLRGRAHVL